MMHPQLIPDPSREVPINSELKCREEWVAFDEVESSDGNEYLGPITFHVTLPNSNSASLEFNCRDKSSGVLLPSERAAASAESSEAEDGFNDPFFFERGYYLEAKTGFQVWPGSRLMVEAFTCMESDCMKYWQDRLARRDLNILEVGAGAGMVGTCLAAAGGRVLATDLPVLVEHGIWPNLRRNGSESIDEESQDFHDFIGDEAENEPARIGMGWAHATVLDWFKPVSEQMSHSTTSSIDVVVACDCMFLRKLVEPLLAVVDTLFRLSARSPRLLFTYQRRNMMGVFSGLEEVLDLMKKKDWVVKCVAWRRIAVEGDGEQDLYLFEAASDRSVNNLLRVGFDEEKKTTE